MLPSSSRVKLNRAAPTDAVPRRRRTSLNKVTADSLKQKEKKLDPEQDAGPVPNNNEPDQTFLTHPENVADAAGDIPEGEPEEQSVGMQETKRRHSVHSRGSYSDFKQDRSHTRDKQSKHNTRSQSRVDLHRKLCCFCTAADSELWRQTKGRRRVKHGAKVSKMSSQIKLSRKPLSTKSQTPYDLQSCRSKSRRASIKDKTVVGNSCRDRGKAEDSGSSVSGWDRQSAAAANTGPPGMSNLDRNTHPSPTGPASSERSLRRAVRASGCGLCGDCKYVSPRWETLGKQGKKSSSPRPEQPAVEVKNKEKNAVTETSQKIVIWIGQNPKVTLCDIAQKCVACSHSCGCVLPDVLKTKSEHCFKQDMRAGFRYEPGCFGHNKHESGESALAKNREFCPRVQSERSVCQSQSLTEHQGHLKEGTDAQTLSGQNTCRFPESWTSEDSATCSASFSLGESTKKGECRIGMWDGDVEENPGPGCCLVGDKTHTDNRIKLKDRDEGGILPSTPDLKSKNPAKNDSRDKEKACSWTSDDSQSCSEHAAGGSSTFGSAMRENSVHRQPCGEIGSPTKTNEAQLSSELLCETNKVDMDDLESFTCQRVRVYFRKNHFSCARTYMCWPFAKSGQTLTAQACPAEPVSPADNSDFPKNQNQPHSLSTQSNDMPTDPSPDTTHQLSCQNDRKREEDGESILADRNGKRHCNMSLYSSGSTNMEAESSLASLPSDRANLSSPRQHGSDAVSASSLLVNGPKTNSSVSTPSPSALGLSDWETATTLSSMSSPFMHGGVRSLTATPSSSSFLLLRKVKSVESDDAFSPNSSVKATEKTLFYCEETQLTSCSVSSSAPPHNSDSFHSCESSPLPPNEQESDEECLSGRCPPKLEPYYTNPINHERSLHSLFTEKCLEFLLPPMLSPVTSPQGRSGTSFLSQSPSCSEAVEGTNEGNLMPQINSSNEESKDYLERGTEELEGVSTNFKPLATPRDSQSSPSTDKDMDDDQDESQDETDCEDYVEQGNKKSEQVPPDPKIKANLSSGVLTEPCSCPSSDEDDGGAFSDEGRPSSSQDEGSSLSEITGSERDQTEVEEAGDSQQGVLDEFTAYERDILLVDVIQDDPELFETLPQESLLKLGPSWITKAPKIRPIGVVKTLSARTDGASQCKQRLTPVKVDFQCDSPDITEEEGNNRPWRPQSSSTPSQKQGNMWAATEKQTKNMSQPDFNNNHVNEGLERIQPIQRVNSPHNHIPPLMSIKNGPWITNPANMAEFRRQKSNAYCRQYFSESLSCGFKMCRFQHVPVEGDEKFCVDTVARFSKNPMCLQKAGAVFTGYYNNNPPGVYFSMPVLLALLWALLKAGMVSDVFSVLDVSLAHKIVPGHEFLLALFNSVREKGLMGLVPELMQLTYKMASAGLVLSLDCLDSVKNTPEFQQTVHPNSVVAVPGNHKLSTSAPFPEYLNLAHSIVEIELCTKQEDWRRMGEVFRSICQSSQRPNQVERISGRIAIALLSESKDKLSLPFAAFAETVCQNGGEDSLIRSSLGRIGVSLMLRYHKTHQWAKGRRVVEVLSISKVSYSTLKGLFGNENGASRCCLVTVATELFLLSGSVEGALNTLRENEWFLSSCSWPCEPADLESRTRVLMRLAEKTSHRDSLDVLCNLPGLKEPNDSVDISRYSPLFNSHLQVCVDRQILPVASDTVDFMFSKNLAVDPTVLHMLIHKLGKQNLWLRAREVFRHSLSVGYYPGVSAPPGFMALIVPCQLGEVELALTFEMFITVNATVILHLSETSTCCLSITLKRTQSCESKYLSAGSRLLSAACIPQPKLVIHYTAVNSSQEQVFTLDIPSARCWLRHNHLWANEVWGH